MSHVSMSNYIEMADGTIIDLTQTLRSGGLVPADMNDLKKYSYAPHGDLIELADGTTVSFVSLLLGMSGGTTANFYIHTQAAASKTWTINHNLAFQYPTITCLDADGNVIVGNVTYLSLNQCIVEFSELVKGKAIIR